MSIKISPTAVKEIKRLQNSRQHTDSYLHLDVKAGGCSGWFYTFDFTQDFDRDTEIDYRFEGIAIVVARSSESLIKDLTLDYSEDLMGGAFRFHNPQAIDICSCGQSFTIASRN